MKNCSSVQVIKATDDTSEEDAPASIVKQVQNAIWWRIQHYESLSDETSIEMDINLKSINQSLGDYVLWHDKNDKLTDLVQIDMVTLNGIETWLAQDFNLGPKKTIWFRGKSLDSETSLHLAILKFANVKITDVDPEHNQEMEQYQVRYLAREIIDGLAKRTQDQKKIGDEIEISYTIEIAKTLQRFTGKSTTNSVLKDVKDKSEKEIRELREDTRWKEYRRASGEAQKVAEKKFFNAYFGVDGVKAFIVDELERPVDTN